MLNIPKLLKFLGEKSQISERDDFFHQSIFDPQRRWKKAIREQHSSEMLGMSRCACAADCQVYKDSITRISAGPGLLQTWLELVKEYGRRHSG